MKDKALDPLVFVLLASTMLCYAINLNSDTLVPIDFRQAANTSTIDTIPGDGKNWTDQGPDNDLRTLKPGVLELPEVAFEILDPKTNDNRSAIMTNSYFCWFYPETIPLVLSSPINVRTMFLLHAAAWMPGKNALIGKLDINYSDGTTDTFEIRGERELGNWQSPRDYDNGRIAWKGSNQGSFRIGIFYSAFPVQDKPVKSLFFRKGTSGTWMVLAATGKKEPFAFPKVKQLQITISDDFKTFETNREIAKNSILDFTHLNDAPAGKYGTIQVKNGEFIPENNHKPIRFYGTNICGKALFITH